MNSKLRLAVAALLRKWDSPRWEPDFEIFKEVEALKKAFAQPDESAQFCPGCKALFFMAAGHSCPGYSFPGELTGEALLNAYAVGQEAGRKDAIETACREFDDIARRMAAVVAAMQAVKGSK